MDRADFGAAVARTLAAIVEEESESFGAIAPERILVVAGAARRDARASIRPLRYDAGSIRSSDGRFEKPVIRVAGVEVLYEICLRPRFFIDASGKTRLLTLVHELWHIARPADGTLDPARRHRVAGGSFEAPVRALAEQLAARGLDRLLEHTGEAWISAWLVRPPTEIPSGSKVRRVYDERDLYPAIVELSRQRSS